ncbi:MAG TPA: metalloregulator ArsR/SmtB family transcription factor [Mycobacteriales bacterium]|nr:metalloregulator ArsR/SmtB family transcription factor [Mycobacteriales bacterium]
MTAPAVAPASATAAQERALDAIGDRSRRDILRRLRRGPLAVSQLAEHLPVTRPAVSQHLKVLLEAGLVAFDRDGTRNVYRLDPRGAETVREWTDALWGDALDRYASRAEQRAQDGHGTLI